MHNIKLTILLTMYTAITLGMHSDNKQLQEIFTAGYDTETVKYDNKIWQWKSEFTKSPPGKKVELVCYEKPQTHYIYLSGTYGALQKINTITTKEVTYPTNPPIKKETLLTPLSKKLIICTACVGVVGIAYWTMHNCDKGSE